MNDLNIRQRKFVRGVIAGKPASTSYADSYGGKASDQQVQSNASRLKSSDKVKKTLEEVERGLASDAAQAYLSYVKLLKDPKTPAQIKEKGYAHIMNLGGLRATQQVDTKNETVLKGLTDKKSIVELAEIAIDKHKDDKDV